ncbi:hypothetical protein L7F22_027782 [Adiantum nelumboides]|nr:hypothetical protein [Adiantum nelumboides]
MAMAMKIKQGKNPLEEWKAHAWPIRGHPRQPPTTQPRALSVGRPMLSQEQQRYRLWPSSMGAARGATKGGIRGCGRAGKQSWPWGSIRMGCSTMFAAKKVRVARGAAAKKVAKGSLG